MTTGNFTDWSGNMLDLGPLYPFVGWEGFMVLVLFIAWIGWHNCCARVAIWKRRSRRRAPSSGSSGAASRHAGLRARPTHGTVTNARPAAAWMPGGGREGGRDAAFGATMWRR
jgi:hypothetical protein